MAINMMQKDKNNYTFLEFYLSLSAYCFPQFGKTDVF